MFFSTVMCGNSAYDWNIMLTGRSYGGTPAMSWPSRKMEPRARIFEAGHHAQQRRLAAARAAEQAEDLALEDLQRNIVDRDEVTETLGDVFDAHVGLGVRITPRLVLVFLVCASFRRLHGRPPLQ